MARGRRRNVTTAEAIRRGALTLYNEAYVRNGRGQRGRAAAERALLRAFPGLGKDVVARIVDRADASRKTSQRYKPAGDTFTLPSNEHQERDCPRRAPPNAPRARYYIYTVEVEVHVMRDGVPLFTHVSRNDIEGNRPLTKGEIEFRARLAAEIEARAFLATSWRRLGSVSVQIGSITITASDTCLM